MSFIVDGCEKLKNGDDYKFISKHRSSSRKGSTWTISLEKELSVADDSILSNYIETRAESPSLNYSYNFVVDNGKYMTVGFDNHYADLILCKFVNSSPCVWHGYPANYCYNIQDKPTQETLSRMLNNNLIDKRMMNKIAKGKR